MSGGLAEGLRDYRRRMEAAVQAGGARAGLRLLSDCTMELPSVPLVEGTLRGSGSVFVNGKLTNTAVDIGYEDGTPATEVDAETLAMKPGEMVVVVGYNSPYAAYQHEGIRQDGTHPVQNYTEPGSGAKFIENKLSENGEDYIAIVAETVKQAMDGQGGAAHA